MHASTPKLASFIDVCRLAYLHEGLEPKVVHRDVKSSNILLDRQWNAKVSDFGLAKLLCSENSYVTTRVMGTFGLVYFIVLLLILVIIEYVKWFEDTCIKNLVVMFLKSWKTTLIWCFSVAMLHQNMLALEC